MQKIINYIIQNYKLILVISAIILLPIMYRGNMEDARKQNVAHAQQQIQTLSGQIKEEAQKLKTLNIEYLKWLECEKANSNTGTLVDCETIDITPKDIK